jgi:hypothetical protein
LTHWHCNVWQARAILRRTESHYLLNRLFLDDYCVFVQQVGDDVLADLAKDYREAAAGLKKADVGLDLPRWEAMATQGTVPKDYMARLHLTHRKTGWGNMCRIIPSIGC